MHFYNKLTYVNVWSLSDSIVPMYRQPQRVIFTDASQFAGAGFTVGDNTIVHFMWEKQDRDKSSTWRELETVANNIQSLENDLSGKFVKIYTNNYVYI
jgi:hypothetical protein